jgi:hypothetical protein
MEQWAILKTLSESSPIFALSIHTTLSQTQTGATVPLKPVIEEQCSVQPANEAMLSTAGQ